MRTKNVLPIAGTVAAVTAVAVTVALLQPGDHAPRPLRLAAGGAASGEAKDAAQLSSSSAAGTGYTLTGTLPAGQSDDAPAYTLPKGPADADVVAALAQALHAGTPVRDGDGWRAGGLFVSGDAGQSWWFAPCAADQPVSPDVRVGCAVAVPGTVEGSAGGSAPNTGSATAPDTPVASPGTGSGTTTTSDGTTTYSETKPFQAPQATPAPSPGTASSGADAPPPAPQASPGAEPDPMSKDAVRTAVKPVFDALSLKLTDARVEGWPYGGSATLTPTVGGLEAYGLQTSVQVDRDGKVQSANGWLGHPDKGDSYPLVTAQAAYDDLPPMMTTMLCPVGPDGKGCGTPQPAEVTGAHLGLMLSALADGGQALVPAWLFEIKGWTDPLPVVAVQAKYLPSPEPAPRDDPATVKPEPGGGAVPPAPPASTDPGSARQGFSFDKAAHGDSPNEVVVTYGDSSSCPHENVVGMAKETPDAVHVVLEADAIDPDTACTEDYRAMERTITLLAPLGDRKVIDAHTGKEVAVSSA